MKRHVCVLAVDFRSGGGENEFTFFAGGFENALRAVHIGFDGAHGAFDNKLDANSGGKVDDDIGIVDEFRNQLEVFNVVQVIFHLPRIFEVADIIHASRGEVVEQYDAIAASKKPLRQMRTNEAGAAGDQVTQSASLQ